MSTNETQIVIERDIPAPAKDIFDFLTLPARHPEADATGTVVSATDTERLQKVGDVFVMNMHADKMGGDYVMHNHVTGLVPNKLVAWQPAPDKDKDNPPGWEWLYELEPIDAGSTTVRLTYDWSKVSDPELVALLPGFGADQLEDSLNKLAAVLGV